MDYSLIVVSVISLIGAVIVTQLYQLNWFKRENFKIMASNVRAENRIKLKKLERELGLPQGKTAPETKGLDIGSVLSMAKGLDPEQLSAIVNAFGGEGESDDSGGWISAILDRLPPETIAGFLQGLQNKAKDQLPPEFQNVTFED